jgi:hypothetical protein
LYSGRDRRAVEVEPGKPAMFHFPADIEGIFEMQSHTEHEGREPLLAKLTVEPG